ncbi:MAG: transposase [Beijerinckiaceae bacterium]|nr:transposase [Beijerinckiaceae bacterium]MBX9934356.1 transposase [Methylobacterium sp.]
MDHFVGIDVSLESCAVCVVNQSGAVVREAKVVCEPEPLIAFLLDLNLDIVFVGLEAGPLSQWLHRHLREAGLEAVLMETRQVKGALKAMPIKTDRRDALGIAHPTSPAPPGTGPASIQSSRRRANVHVRR